MSGNLWKGEEKKVDVTEGKEEVKVGSEEVFQGFGFLELKTRKREGRRGDEGVRN